MHRHPMPASAQARQERERPHHAQAEPRFDATESTATPLDFTTIRTLALRPATLTASLTMPVHRSGQDHQQNHLRMKNLLKEAENQLGEVVTAAEAEAILAPAHTLVAHTAFWSNSHEGLALFCNSGGCTQVWSPLALPEEVVVGEHCQIKSLLPALQDNGAFCLLEISQHGVRLHAGTRFTFRALPLAESVHQVAEKLAAEHHGGVRSIHGGGQGDARHFGSAGEEKGSEAVKQYYRRVDAAMCDLLHGQTAPLVLAGVENQFPLYRAVNTYPHLVATGITGNTTPLTTAELHAQAWKIVEPLFRQATDEACARALRLHASGLASYDLDTILRAAAHGRVDDLFVADDSERWGHEKANGGVTVHSQRHPGDEEILNSALIKAMAHGGRIHVLPRAAMPGGGAIAGVFRY
jgi:hypothetical protein